MKKGILKSSVLAGLLSLFMSFSSIKDSSLTDISKPYLGEYECKEAVFDGEDYLKNFSYIRLELKRNETFTLSYCDKEKRKDKVEGKYVYDEEAKTICLLSVNGEGIKRSFPFENGKINITLSIAKKMLILQFEQK